MKTEIRLFGGDLDGMVLSINDHTATWPLAITFDVPELDKPLVTFKRLRYVQWHSDGNRDESETWSDYYIQESTTISCGIFDPMLQLPKGIQKPPSDQP